MTRLLTLAVALIFIAGFGFLTFSAVEEQGLTLASALSILILALLAVGIIGSLRHPPR